MFEIGSFSQLKNIEYTLHKFFKHYINLQYKNKILKTKIDSYSFIELYGNCKTENGSFTILFLEFINEKKIALNIYEKGSHIEFMVSINGYDQFDNIEVTCPGINNEILSIGKKYHIFDLRSYNFDNYFRYETLIDVKKIENSTEYEFYFENIDKPFKTFTRGHVNDSSKIIHRFDYIVFDYFKGNFLQNILKLTTNQISILETQDSIKHNSKYFDIIQKTLELRKEFNL